MAKTDRAMGAENFGLVSADEQWEMFDGAARRLLGVAGAEFAERWDRGEFSDRDAPGVQQVAILRPQGWTHAR